MPQSDLTPMYVLTVKRDGGTQDVLGFYAENDFDNAVIASVKFMAESRESRRAIVRLEWYNPHGASLDSPPASGTIAPSQARR